jgi:phage shock protein PspC (stress-responsive transcriptional regulator)
MSGLIGLVGLLLLVGIAVYGHKQGCRRSTDSVLGGVCAGLAPKLDLPVTAVRIIAVLLLLFTGGTALLLYVFAWLIWRQE